MTSPYRDDYDSLFETLRALEAELDGARTLAAQADEARLREARLRAELQATRERLANLSERRRLPLLSNLKVASPCSADWEAMSGDARERHCSSCDKSVYNISELSKDEAEAFLRERAGGGVCVRYFVRHDGTILNADCPVGAKRVERRRRLRRVVIGGSLGLGAVVGVGMLAMRGAPIAPVQGQLTVLQADPAPSEQPGRWTMGDMSAPDPGIEAINRELEKTPVEGH